MGRIVDAIETLTELRLKGFQNDSINNCIVIWTAVEYFSSSNKEKYSEKIREEKFDFVRKHCMNSALSNPAYSSYKYMLLKVCKHLNVLPTHADSKKIVDIITSANFDCFSEEERIYNDAGKERPYFSEKEELYTYLIKAYWNLEAYKSCSEQCKIALEHFDGRLHHKNNFWFLQKQLICDIKIKIETGEDYQEDLARLKSNCRRTKHFSSLKHLGDVYMLMGDCELALAAYSEAYLYDYDGKDLQLKIGVLKQIAIICENISSNFMARQCYALIIKLRKKNNWEIKKDLQSKAEMYSITDDTKIKHKNIINFCIFNLKKQKFYIGKVINNNQIVCDNFKKKYISFNKKDVLNPKIYNDKYINGSVVAFKFLEFKTGKTKNIYIGVR